MTTSAPAVLIKLARQLLLLEYTMGPYILCMLKLCCFFSLHQVLQPPTLVCQNPDVFHQWFYDYILCILYSNHFEVWHYTRFHFTLDYPKPESWSIPKRKAPCWERLLSSLPKARPCSVFLQTSTRDGQEGTSWWYLCFYPEKLSIIWK